LRLVLLLTGHKGSYVIYRHPVSLHRAVVPKHARPLPKGTVKAIIREAGIDAESFFNA
jgi:predicted RNA binding protein YcfA (HicA-like mRNA interferase family)